MSTQTATEAAPVVALPVDGPAAVADPASGDHERRLSQTREGRRSWSSSAWVGGRGALGERLALLGIVALAAMLRIVGLEREAFANTYYAAAVKSMLTGWRAFLFASFDSAGFVTVDKPPVGLWVQAAIAKLFELFGATYSGLSLLLPQAIAGVLAVVLLYWLVCRVYGPAAGLLAGLALAVTPITVVTDRNNTMDAQLVLVLLLAAWAATLAAERGRLRPLLLSAILLGLAYNIKMLQAFLVLPACWAVYLLLAPRRLGTRLAHLVLATIVLLAVSLSWSIVVDLMPRDARPYIGSSGSNSALSLALGYNGLGRLTSAIAERLPIPGLDGLTVDLTSAPGFAPGIGNPGMLRLFSGELAGQASWLLPLAMLGLLVAGYQLLPHPIGLARIAVGTTDREAVRREQVALVLWGLWLAGTAGYFTVARFYHIYYLIMLGPGVAALAGIGVAAGWRGYRQGGRLAWTLPTMLAVCAVVQIWLLAGYATWSAWLTPAIVGGCGVAMLGLLVGFLVRRWQVGRLLASVAAGIGCLALLAAPTVWSGVSVANNNGAAWLPQAGPPGGGFGFRGGPRGGPAGPGFGGGPGGGGPGSGSQFQGGGPRGGFGGPGFGGGPAFDGGRRGGGPGFSAGPNGIQNGGPGGGFPGPNGGPGGPGIGPGGGPRGGGAGAMTFAGDQWDSIDADLVQYLLANQGSATFLVATPTSSYASLFMLATDQPAMALGGYQGWDRILSPEQLATLVHDGVVRYFWMNESGPGGFGSGGRGGPGDGQAIVSSSQDATGDLLTWVRSSCAVVSPEAWQGADADGAERGDSRGLQLYDCGSLARQG